MSVVIEVRRPGANGRLWLLHPRPEAQRQALIRQVHMARCGLGESVRAVQRRLEDGGARVARGTVANWLAWYGCELCAGDRDVTRITILGGSP